MRQWFKNLFSDSGMASMSRTAAFIALLFSCGWVTYLVIKNTALPELGGIAAFVGTPYGLGKLGETIAKFQGGSMADDK
jgi:hypothetical protein